ncbi:MAG TPA: hypothetical protein VF581_04385 [Flavobacterium sp.]|jgi:hypothetical protein
MKNFFLKLTLLLIMLTTFTSCEIIGDILEAGIVIGIIIVLVIVGLIYWIIRKFKRRS